MHRFTRAGKSESLNSWSHAISVGLPVKRLSCERQPRARGQAARHLPQLTVQPAGDVCKRRDSVHLALTEPARPAGAVFGLSSGATSS